MWNYLSQGVENQLCLVFLSPVSSVLSSLWQDLPLSLQHGWHPSTSSDAEQAAQKISSSAFPRSKGDSSPTPPKATVNITQYLPGSDLVIYPSLHQSPWARIWAHGHLSAKSQSGPYLKLEGEGQIAPECFWMKMGRNGGFLEVT